MILILGLVGIAACGHQAPPPPTPDPAARRMTTTGPVVGFVGTYGDHAWRGIPYAKAPVGALRWRAPEAPMPSSETREALVSGPPCTQYGSPLSGIDGVKTGEPIGSEDCLSLSVFAPRWSESSVPTGTARLPVMVWIHGGGNTIGQAGFYNGGNLATTEKVVVVALNYRLGPFGWFRNAALRGEGTSAAEQSGNFATLDLVRGLEWVRDNIAAFGGDPNNVTIFGESAGGTNVFTLLLSPIAKGLFHKAIVESGSLRLSTVAAAENPSDAGDPGHANSSTEVVLRLLISDGRASDRVGAKAALEQMSPDEVAQYLRGKSNIEILTAYTVANTGMIDMPRVIADGSVLPKDDALSYLTRADGYNRVPVIVGTNRDENKLFMFGQPEHVRRILWVLPRLRDEHQYNVSAEYLAKMWKAIGADGPATAMGSNQSNVFVYRFDWDEEPTIMGADLSVMLGASHGFEIPFVFGHFDLGREGNQIFTSTNEPGRKELSRQMMSYWAEFAYTGKPGRGRAGDLVDWKPWDAGPDARQFNVLDTAANGGVRMSTDIVTQATLLAAVDTDSRLPAQRDRCHIYRELAAWSPSFTKDDYLTAGRQGCAEYPYDGFPWSN